MGIRVVLDPCDGIVDIKHTPRSVLWSSHSVGVLLDEILDESMAVSFNGYAAIFRGNSLVLFGEMISIFGFGCPISVMFDLQLETWNKHHEVVIPIDSWVPEWAEKNWNHHWYPWIHSRWLKQC